jgi:muramidase (phage lysozyme)
MPVTYSRSTSDRHLRTVMERLSELTGRTVVVHSGDRNFVPSGGSRTSLHLAHRAVDFHVTGISDASVLEFFRANFSRLLDRTEGYELIRHGQYTSTGGPHVHLGHFDGRHSGQVLVKLEGLTPSTRGNYSLETVAIGVGNSVKIPSSNPPIIESNFRSVGQNGVNQNSDVRSIQDLLNLARQRLITAGIRFQTFRRLREDGLIGSRTIEAIRIFQRDILNFQDTDGRVDPGGRTLRALRAIASGDLSAIRHNIHNAASTPTGNSGNVTRNSPAEALVTDSRIKAFLEVLGFTEGTGTNYGKVVNGTVISAPFNPELVGRTNVSVTDLSRHPNILVRVNASLRSTAAGRYQFLKGTWDELNMSDFSAPSQDIAAVKLMIRRRMIDPLLAGNLRLAVTRGAPEWASLPTASGGSYYGGQPSRSFGEISTRYNASLRN